MSMVWSHDSTNIYDIVTAEFANQALLIRGTGTRFGKFFEWKAAVTSEGWYVTIGDRGSVQGSTFNLQLEVATAASRLL
jgi:hypothetical protein